MEHLRAELPGLALAAHTVASPQIRNRGGVGGNLGTASPAGDAHPALLAAGRRGRGGVAARGTRMIPIDDFYTGVKRNALAPDELIRAVHIAEGGRPAAVLQGRHPQRHGHRRLRLRPRPAPGDPHRAHRHRLRRAHPGPGRGGRGVPDRRAGGGRLLGQRQAPSPPSVASSSPQLCAAACQPHRRRARHRRLPPARASASWPAARSSWTWEAYRGRRRANEGAA